MRQSKWLGRRHAMAATAIVLALAFAAFFPRKAASETVVTDGAPSGMVAFFPGGGCPAGWQPQYEISGYVLVGTVSKDEIGVAVGMPLGDQEERTHEHDYVGALELPPKNIAGANGGNDNGAASATYAVTGTTSAETSDLPLMQMKGCIKQ